MQVLCYNSSQDSCGSIIYLYKTPMTASILLFLGVKHDVLAICFGDSLTMAMYTSLGASFVHEELKYK